MVHHSEYLAGRELAVSMTADLDAALREHFAHRRRQEDLTFALWRPGIGRARFTAVLQRLVPPQNGERILDGNVAFTGDYIARVLGTVPDGYGIALLHSHLGPGWQDLSLADDIAERQRLASAVAGRTQLPLVGLTWGTDGTWSARLWGRSAPFTYDRHDAAVVRVVGAEKLALSFHPTLRSAPAPLASQQATVSVWGHAAQADLARTRVGVVGLGSVGSIVAEALARVGITSAVFIDHDHIEQRNLDRTLHSTAEDAHHAVHKVRVAERAAHGSYTAATFDVVAIPVSVLTPDGAAAVLDCDAVISCVDRPLPRWLLNTVAYSHLVPVIDGGILARVTPDGRPLHVDWRIQTVGPGRACLFCIGALLRSDVSLDRAGLLDDPDYLRGLSEKDRERYNRRNVFPFSLAVAAHEVLQVVGMIAGSQRIAGIGPQHYAAYPGEMTVTATTMCHADCEIAPLTASAVDLDELRPGPPAGPSSAASASDSAG